MAKAVWFAPARWVFDWLAASGCAGCVPCVGLFGALHRKADGHAVAGRGRCAVNWRGDEEGGAIVQIDEAAFGISDAFIRTNGGEDGVVEGFGFFDVVRADHHM